MVVAVKEAEVVDKNAKKEPQGKSLQQATQAAPAAQSYQVPKVSFSRDEACARLTETAAAFLQEIQASYPEEIELDADKAALRYVRGMAGRGLLVDITIRIF